MAFSAELKVGIFALIGLSVLLATAVVLGGNPFANKKNYFYTLLDNAGGIGERTQVRVAGVQVGEVTKIKIVPEGARVDFSVSPDVSIPVGSSIVVKSRGVLGDVYLEIERDQKSAQMLRSGDFLQRNPQSNDLQTLIGNMNAIARDLKQVSGTLAKVLGGEEQARDLKDFLANLEGMASDLRDVTSSQKKNLKDTIKSLSETAQRLSGLLRRNDSRIDKIVSDLGQFTAQLRSVSTPENTEKINKILENVEKATDSLQKISQKVEKGEGTLGQLITKDDTANEIKSTIKSVQDVLKPITQIRLKISDRAEFRLANAQTKDKFANEFNLILATRPDRYYLIGVTNAAYARKVTQTTMTTATNGGTTTTDTQENTSEDTGNFRFNLQIAQRFGFFGVRLGLFASSGGFAGDFYAFHDRLMGSVEFSQFGGSPTPSDMRYGAKGPFNLKAYVNLFVTPYLFVTGGVDGMVLNKNPFPFLGAGFWLSDDDIKGLIGLGASVSSVGR